LRPIFIPWVPEKKPFARGSNKTAILAIKSLYLENDRREAWKTYRKSHMGFRLVVIYLDLDLDFNATPCHTAFTGAHCAKNE